MIPMIAEAREHLAADLITDEGVKLYAYKDHLGFWTIGIGRLIDHRRGGGITYEEALYLLDNDIERKWRELISRLPWIVALSLPRQCAFANLAFNLGVDGLIKFRNTLAAAQRGDWLGVEQGLRASLWYRQVQRSRSERIIKMLRTGQWPEAA
jgi:lysozyme